MIPPFYLRLFLSMHQETKTAPDETTTLEQQAAGIEEMLPALARHLFTTDPTHPLADMPVAQLRLSSFLLISPQPPTMSRIAEELRISVSAVTQLADRLVRAGLAERVLSAEAVGGGGPDRRARHLRLTEHGRELLRSRRDSWRQSTRAALERLTPEQREQVLASLRLLLDATQADASPPLEAAMPQMAAESYLADPADEIVDDLSATDATV